MKELLSGRGIRTSENLLSKKLNVHRITIERRISTLMDHGIITAPACTFFNHFFPPEHIFVYCLMEIRKSKQKILKKIRSDPHVPLAWEANVGRYNMLLFKVFFSIKEHFLWEERYDNEYPGSIGAMKKIFIAPQMTVSIDERKIAMGIIQKKRTRMVK